MVNYSIGYENDDEIEEICRNARVSPEVETQKFRAPEYPSDHFSTFEPSEMYRTPNDHYFWYSGDDWENCFWDTTEGHNSEGSLRMKNGMFGGQRSGQSKDLLKKIQRRLPAVLRYRISWLG